MGFFSSIRNLFQTKTDQPSADAPDQDVQAAQAATEQAGGHEPDVSSGAEATSSSAEHIAQAPAQPEQAPVNSEQAEQAEPEQAPVNPQQAPDLSTQTAPEPQGMFATAEYKAMTAALRGTEPRLSAWLEVVLQGVTQADTLLWERVHFLLSSLEAPEEEIERFISNVRAWLDNMGYEALEDFRSELQYRLAIALNLEDEEDERSRLLSKLSEGLAKTREHLSRNLNRVFAQGRAIDPALWEELEETLVMADVGFETAMKLTENLRRRAEIDGITDASLLRGMLAEEALAAFKPVRRITTVNPPEVILVVGVNGVGKTTTIAKLGHRAVLQGKKVFLAAGDTFRAAATEQLEIWANRMGAGFFAKGHGADPAAVAYEAMDIAIENGYDTVIIDTAGRLHTKANLMEELRKIERVVAKRHPGAPHRTILVIDSTTGQNALAQIKMFNEAVPLNELILTKLDGTAKGGIAVAAAMQFGIPISFIGLGEKMEDLRPFVAEDFVKALLD